MTSSRVQQAWQELAGRALHLGDAFYLLNPSADLKGTEGTPQPQPKCTTLRSHSNREIFQELC